jgi:erythromycin esterase-like protein
MSEEMTPANGVGIPMLINPQAHAISAIAAAAWPLAFSDDETDYAQLLKEIGDARVVLIGEASHGTHEFYRERARITRMLIEQKGFHAVAVEADWPDAYRLNRYVRYQSTDADAEQALGGFRRFPAWMWRNMDVLAFAEWLRQHNGTAAKRVGFYGLDLYSMYGSAQEVVRYLEGVDPQAAARARYRYACFEHFGEDSQA